MSSFGNDIVCKNIQCNTVNGQTYNPVQTSKWTETNNVLEPATAGASVKISGLEVDVNARVNGEINNTANNQTDIDLFGTKTSGNSFIGLNTAGVDIPNASTIYFINFEKKPDTSTNNVFRINMSGDIIGCKDIDCNKSTTKTLRYENLDMSNFPRIQPIAGQGIRILKFPSNTFGVMCIFQLEGNETGTQQANFKIQHADTDVNDEIVDDYVLICEGLGFFTTSANRDTLVASSNCLGGNNLELRISSLFENFSENDIIRFFLKLTPHSPNP